jgi:hypothetical protein
MSIEKLIIREILKNFIAFANYLIQTPAFLFKDIEFKDNLLEIKLDIVHNNDKDNSCLI